MHPYMRQVERRRGRERERCRERERDRDREREREGNTNTNVQLHLEGYGQMDRDMHVCLSRLVHSPDLTKGTPTIHVHL